MIIGLTGTNGAGKGEVAKYLKKKKFKYFSLSDIVREETAKRKLEHTRENFIRVGNELRIRYGAGILAQRIISKIKKLRGNADIVVDSIRNPKEVEILRKISDFSLLAIDASVKIRYSRILKRKRIDDKGTLKGFVRNEKLENSNNPSSQQLKKCIGLADKIIINNKTKLMLHKKTDGFLKWIKENTK
ncbi:MAG: AAA family ATPase [Candidatus Firestonebacteria bacterium]